MNEITVTIATRFHLKYLVDIEAALKEAASGKGNGIAVRSQAYLREKILEGKSVIAFHQDGRWAGFCYIESWGHKKFVANSGLIVSPEFRGLGLAGEIKRKAFELSGQLFPGAKLFGLTTSLAVMKINSELGYKPVTFSELTDDEAFWEGCRTCPYYDILVRTGRTHCLCTAMLMDPDRPDKRNGQKQVHATPAALKTI
ncbi:MAG: GNAT family N-acetyltransferase [Bacteroidales bacterium]|nr:GNAT family N-acetyltransferase [Bacteroidales bacterium]MBN2697610.1 GNAT family N-acetyltransferase [Bacteroidales bacterium]